MVAVNPDALDEISDYTGLSKNMLSFYGKALDHVGTCTADKSGYKILGDRELKE